MIQVKPGEEFHLPCTRCPECGGELRGEVAEWYEDTKEPTDGGLWVWCEHDSPNDPVQAPTHRSEGTDWIPIQAICDRWAAKNVRVIEPT